MLAIVANNCNTPPVVNRIAFNVGVKASFHGILARKFVGM
jgi:hypothetical protein